MDSTGCRILYDVRKKSVNGSTAVSSDDVILCNVQ